MKLKEGKEQSQCKIGGNSLKSQEKKQFSKYETPILTTSSSTKNVTNEEYMLDEEVAKFEPRVQLSMVEKLTKVVENMEQEIHMEDNINCSQLT